MQLDAVEADIAETIGAYYDNPYGYVMFAFPWGRPGGPLEHETGPDKWQAEQLTDIGNLFLENPEATLQDAIASGHGVGKSCEVAWLVLWAMSTRPHLAGWVTANTQTQLKSKTWRELAVWHKRAINRHWFEWTATRFAQVDNKETWGVDAIPWTERNSEAFAGLHGEHVLMIMDEASAISDIIWEVAEGAMTTPKAMWFAFGNPTRNSGLNCSICFSTSFFRRCRRIHRVEPVSWPSISVFIISSEACSSDLVACLSAVNSVSVMLSPSGTYAPFLLIVNPPRQ